MTDSPGFSPDSVICGKQKKETIFNCFYYTPAEEKIQSLPFSRLQLYQA
ncbi:MAG: hypothetical protein IJ452_08830 [Butyricicoccus sp.]|nr:hypothetical protein [Butyricicoccus sp.]